MRCVNELNFHWRLMKNEEITLNLKRATLYGFTNYKQVRLHETFEKAW